MKVLNYDELDIVGFAGVRERILVMDSRVFGYHRREDTWQGYGQLTYLAHAYLKPGGSTGRHSHSDVDIVSIVTRGQVRHEGSVGDVREIYAGQVMVQRSGGTGFMHNEINPDDDITGMVQLWLAPGKHVADHASQTVLTPQPGTTFVYQGLDTSVELHWLAMGEQRMSPDTGLGYVFEGELICGDQALPRGTLFQLEGSNLSVGSDEAKFLIIRSCMEGL